MIKSTQIENVCNGVDDYACATGCESCPHVRPVVWASVALCESRHPTPATDGSIFPQEVDPTDVTGLTRHAVQVIRESGVQVLTVYVTGLTVALVAVINACHTLGVELTLQHYNRETGNYFTQFVK